MRAVTILAERPKCVYCGKEAIGFQSFGCGCACVCGDHAHSILLAIRPGEKYSSGECFFRRFDIADT